MEITDGKDCDGEDVHVNYSGRRDVTNQVGAKLSGDRAWLGCG